MSSEEYIGMVNNKTSGLLRMGVKIMMACATTNIDVDYVPFVNLIGVFFQIRDDLMNLQSAEVNKLSPLECLELDLIFPPYTSNKGFAEDLSEGKFSFPVVHGIHADTSNRHILNVLQKRLTTPTLKIHAISYLKDHSESFEYTVSVLRVIEAKTRAEIAKLGGNIGLDRIMDPLHVDETNIMVFHPFRERRCMVLKTVILKECNSS
ncbi:hypothetical protein K443DRAFT_93211 [Laccaria amethystina LaAM-08-1]|uniref:(2E,6E)-farnesyl diphosphate synthase n=1 Tax=Laccaria amethystina LaAM-08-1 TaxID=1095629 RepID=A0A0C9Y2V3_9AGAR|nr:hypothetical protein K443DRAFT_93211 [Laccaria amethystina LaAM-08-1]